MSEVLKALRKWDEYAAPTERWESTGQLIHEAADALEQTEVRREALAAGREHLTVTNEFQSDKYRWCPAGFVPLKLTDLMARDLLWDYANLRHSIDAEFSRDLEDALVIAGEKS